MICLDFTFKNTSSNLQVMAFEHGNAEKPQVLGVKLELVLRLNKYASELYFCVL